MKKRSAAIAARVARHDARVRMVQRRLLQWFPKHGRKFPWREPNASLYYTVVSELLLQRTRAEAVSRFFERFVKRFPSWQHLAGASDEEMQEFLAPLGLWRRRSVSLRALGAEMKRRRDRFPKHRSEIEKLPGIGQYIASAVLLFSHGESAPLLDVNMARVLERCFGVRKLADIRYDPWLQAIAHRVTRHRRSREINWAILDVAATSCSIKAPECASCPLHACCRFSRAKSISNTVRVPRQSARLQGRPLLPPGPKSKYRNAIRLDARQT